MNWWECVLTGISVICTIISLVGAYRANRYYRKSKQLNNYAKTNIAFVEIGKIINEMTELIGLTNRKLQVRGSANSNKIAAEKGVSIKKSFNIIMETLCSNDLEKILSKFNLQEFNVEHYIDAIIAGAKDFDLPNSIDDDFNSCQQSFRNMQSELKKMKEDQEEKLK